MCFYLSVAFYYFLISFIFTYFVLLASMSLFRVLYFGGPFLKRVTNMRHKIQQSARTLRRDVVGMFTVRARKTVDFMSAHSLLKEHRVNANLNTHCILYVAHVSNAGL